MPNGSFLARAAVDPTSPFALAPGELPGFVLGHFEAGPGFSPVGVALAASTEAYEGGDPERWSALHETLDAMALVAVDAKGKRYSVSNVHFREGEARKLEKVIAKNAAEILG